MCPITRIHNNKGQSQVQPDGSQALLWESLIRFKMLMLCYCIAQVVYVY